MKSPPLWTIAALLALVAAFALWNRGDAGHPGPLPATPAPAEARAPAAPAQRSAARAALEAVPDTFGPPRPTAAEALAGVRPEARPVAALLWAVAAGDLGMLPGLYAPKAARQIEHVGWGEHASLSAALLLRRLGRYEGGGFGFDFETEGDGAAGRVTVRRGSRTFGPLRVVRSGPAWQLAEP
jgi:hypothetical protein